MFIPVTADVLAGNTDVPFAPAERLKLPSLLASAPKLGVTEKPALAPDLVVEPAKELVPNPALNGGLAADSSDFEDEAGTPELDVNGTV